MFQYFSKFTSSTLKYTLSYFQGSCNPQLINLWINDIQTGIDALFDDQLKSAQEVFSRYGTQSPFHSFGLAMLTYTIAMLDSEKMNDAINTISNVESEIKHFLKKRKKEASIVGEIIPDEQQHNCRKRRKSQQEDAIDLHFELLSANCILMAATLQLLRANWIDHIKAAYELRKALLIYERIFESIQGVSISEYKSVFNQCNKAHNNKNDNTKSAYSPSTQQDKPFLFDDTLEHGAYFGIGLFSLMFALLPPKVSKLLSSLGYKSSRSNAIQFLQNASNSRTMYAPLSAVALLSFYTNISIYIEPQLNHFLSLKDANSILERMKTRFSNGKIWFLLDSKLNRLKRNPNHCLNLLKQAKNSPPTTALHSPPIPPLSSSPSPPSPLSSQSSKFLFSKDTFQEDESDYLRVTSISQLPQFRCFVLYDLGWSYIYVGDYFQASESFFCLASLSNWSRIFYHFLSTCCMIAQGTYEKAALEAQQILTMINDKKRLGHKLSVNELYAQGKIRDWFLISKRHNKPLKFILEFHLINPIWELVYLWNGISYWHPEVLEYTKQTIQNRLLNEKHSNNENSEDNNDDDDNDYENDDSGSQSNNSSSSKKSTKSNSRNSNSSEYSSEDNNYSIMLLIMGVIERDIQHDNKKALKHFNSILRQPNEKTNWIFAYAMYETAVTHCKQKKECSSLTSTWICRVEDYYIEHPDDNEWHSRMQLRCQLLLESQILKTF